MKIKVLILPLLLILILFSQVAEGRDDNIRDEIASVLTVFQEGLEKTDFDILREISTEDFLKKIEIFFHENKYQIVFGYLTLIDYHKEDTNRIKCTYKTRFTQKKRYKIGSYRFNYTGLVSFSLDDLGEKLVVSDSNLFEIDNPKENRFIFTTITVIIVTSIIVRLKRRKKN